jgi:hypothetical protein
VISFAVKVAGLLCVNYTSIFVCRAICSAFSTLTSVCFHLTTGDIWSAVWHESRYGSVGCVLAELFTGKQPLFAGDDKQAVVAQVGHCFVIGYVNRSL